MSKASKPGDLWSQVFSAAATRPNDFCTGCGYFHHCNGYHRADCTAKSRAPSFRAVDALTGAIAPLPPASAADHFPSVAVGSTPDSPPAGVDHPPN